MRLKCYCALCSLLEQTLLFLADFPSVSFTVIDEDIDKDMKENENKPRLYSLYCQKSLLEVSQEDATLGFRHNHPSASAHFHHPCEKDRDCLGRRQSSESFGYECYFPVIM